MICPPTLGNDSAKKAEIYGEKVANRYFKCYTLVMFVTAECLCAMVSVTDFIQAACDCGKAYLTTFAVDLLY